MICPCRKFIKSWSCAPVGMVLGLLVELWTYCSTWLSNLEKWTVFVLSGLELSSSNVADLSNCARIAYCAVQSSCPKSSKWTFGFVSSELKFASQRNFQVQMFLDCWIYSAAWLGHRTIRVLKTDSNCIAQKCQVISNISRTFCFALLVTCCRQSSARMSLRIWRFPKAMITFWR